MHVCGVLKLRSRVFFKRSPHCSRGLTEPRACQLQLLYLFSLLQESLASCFSTLELQEDHYTHHAFTCVLGGGLNPRPCICESSALITELSFQPPLPSFNLVCQIIQKVYSRRVMPNHLTIIVSLQNCDSESRMHGNPWLCDTPSTPVWTELRFLYVRPGSLIYPKISSCGYLWEEALGLGKEPLLAGVTMEDPLGN